MLQQLFKLMWKGKKKNFLILLEIFFSFMVLFGTSTLIIKTLDDYFTAKGFDHERVYVLRMEPHGDSGEGALEKVRSVKNLLRSMPEIESYSLSGVNTPYAMYASSSTYSSDNASYMSHEYQVDPEFKEVLKLELLEGRWLQSGDHAPATRPVVINENLAKALFPDGDALGKTVSDGRNFQVVGIIKGFTRFGEFSGPDNSIIRVNNPLDTANLLTTIVFRIKASIDPQWQQSLIEQVGALTGNWTHELIAIEDDRAFIKRSKLIMVSAPAIICAFLVINVAMGLFGVLWQNISKRYAEIGIRRAVGATQGDIRFQIVGEMLAMATLALFMGLLLAIQFPLLGVFNVSHHIYALAIGSSLLIIYLLVAFCALYPSIQASRIEPATALHYE